MAGIKKSYERESHREECGPFSVSSHRGLGEDGADRAWRNSPVDGVQTQREGLRQSRWKATLR